MVDKEKWDKLFDDMEKLIGPFIAPLVAADNNPGDVVEENAVRLARTTTRISSSGRLITRFVTDPDSLL